MIYLSPFNCDSTNTTVAFSVIDFGPLLQIWCHSEGYDSTFKRLYYSLKSCPGKLEVN